MPRRTSTQVAAERLDVIIVGVIHQVRRHRRKFGIALCDESLLVHARAQLRQHLHEEDREQLADAIPPEG